MPPQPIPHDELFAAFATPAAVIFVPIFTYWERVLQRIFAALAQQYVEGRMLLRIDCVSDRPSACPCCASQALGADGSLARCRLVVPGGLLPADLRL